MTPIFINKQVFLDSRRSSSRMLGFSSACCATASNGLVTAILACGLACGSLAKWMTKISYNGYRFPPDIIQQAIWLYLRFTLSFRDVEDLLAERGIMVSYSY